MKTLAIATLVLLAAGPADKTPKDPIIITAGSVQVKKSELEAALDTLPPEYQGYAKGAGKKQFAEDYLRMRLLAAAGMKAGLDKTPEVVEQLRLMKQNLVANAQMDKIEKGTKISDEDLQKKYEARKSDYEEVVARHILVAFQGSPAAQEGKPDLTEEQAKAKAESLRKQLVEGASFEAIAQKESDDTGSGARGGDLGAFARGQMVPEFEKAAFEAKVGELSPVVRTQYGYHVIKVEKHDVAPFEQVKPALEREERKARLENALTKIVEDAKPVYDATYFAN